MANAKRKARKAARVARREMRQDRKVQRTARRQARQDSRTLRQTTRQANRQARLENNSLSVANEYAALEAQSLGMQYAAVSDTMSSQFSPDNGNSGTNYELTASGKQEASALPSWLFPIAIAGLIVTFLINTLKDKKGQRR